MMINSFNDYLLIEHFSHDDKFEVLNEKNLSSNINKDIKFGVIMPTFRLKKDGEIHASRAKYSESINLLKDAIGSLKGQSFKNWKLYLVGDAYEDDQEVKDLLSSMLKSDQYVYHNLSKPGERDDNSLSSEEICMTGGTAACNKGLSMADKDGIKYVTRLDHDDKWKSNHLELLARAYTQYPNLGFAFTQARKKSDSPGSSGSHILWPKTDHELEPNNKGYTVGSTAHTSVSWRPDLIGKFRYRSAKDQKSTEPKNSKVIAGDVDMFTRMMDKIKSSDDLQYMYIPTLTTYVRNRKGKF